MSRVNTRTLLTVIFCLAVLGSACTATGRGSRKDRLAAANAEGGENELLDPSVDVAEAAIRGKEFQDIADLQPVYFEFDSYSLTRKSRVTLRDNAEYLKAHPSLEVLVEGHTDERGTTQYNLALGQKRAKTVREYYIRLGVPGKSLATLSFGEERPLCAQSTEECWSRNRRSATKIRAQISSNHVGGDEHEEVVP